MKTTIFSMVLSIGLMLNPIIATSTKVDHKPVKFYYRTEPSFILDALTIYNPVAAQCDATPLITASNRSIDPEKLRRQELRWMALSRDLLTQWRGTLQYGDTVLVTSGDVSIDGLWIIHDTMNQRFNNRGDLLFDSTVRTLGRWDKVEVTKIKWFNPA